MTLKASGEEASQRGQGGGGEEKGSAKRGKRARQRRTRQRGRGKRRGEGKRAPGRGKERGGQNGEAKPPERHRQSGVRRACTDCTRPKRELSVSMKIHNRDTSIALMSIQLSRHQSAARPGNKAKCRRYITLPFDQKMTATARGNGTQNANRRNHVPHA